MYDSQNIEPAPTLTLYIEKAFKLTGMDGTRTGHSFKIEIPEGYTVKGGQLRVVHGSTLGAIFHIGNSYFTLAANEADQSNYFIQDLYSEDGLRKNASEFEFTASIVGSSATVKVSIEFERTHPFYEKWRMKTYNAIMNGYNLKLAEYNEKLSLLLLNNGPVTGDNPAINTQTIKEQLKRSCIKIMHQSNYPSMLDGDAITEDYFGGERAYMNHRESFRRGKKAMAYENTFDWDNVTYKLLPYFWADACKSDDECSELGTQDTVLKSLKQLKDTDKSFQDFLQAGMAKVTVPVNPEHVDIVLEYLDNTNSNLEDLTGTGSLSGRNKELNELKEELNSSKDAITTNGILQSCWAHIEPTSLVMLITNDTLENLPDNSLEVGPCPKFSSGDPLELLN